MRGPLQDLQVAEEGDCLPVEVAGWLLAGLGADVVRLADPSTPFGRGRFARRAPGAFALSSEPVERGAWLADPGVPLHVDGLPPGTVDYAAGLALGAGVLLAALGGGAVEVSRRTVAALVMLPDVMAASYAAPQWTRPPQPLAVGDGFAGGGFVAADLGPDDTETFQRLVAVLGPDERDAETVAARAQEWRLPVLPYRSRPAVPPRRPVAYGCGWHESHRTPTRPRTPVEPELRTPPLDGVLVADLTAMWAGPLCTWLLAASGADVVKVEPDCRLDGLRAVDGRGIHPNGDASTDGNRSALYNALNRNKRRLDADLRDEQGRLCVQELVSACDLVVDAFSPRVMPNLGLEHRRLQRLRPGIVSVSIPAFPPGSPRRDWVAYGTGIHAVSGLGDTGSSFAAPAVTYPDALTGLAAFAVALAALAGRRLGWEPRHVEVALESATLPLLRVPDAEETETLDATKLLDEAWTVEVADAAGVHRYPAAPFAGPGLPVSDVAAPRI